MYIIYIYSINTYIYTTNVYCIYIYIHRKNTYHDLYWAILCIGTTIEVVSYTEHAAGFNGTPINGFPPKN